MSRSKRIGTAWESAIVAFLRDKGFPYAERRALTGAHDMGDITGLPGVCIEAKAVKQAEWSEYLNEAEEERDNARADVGVLWAKRRGYTSPGRAYVVMTGDDFVWLLKSAGYGEHPGAVA